MNLMRGCVNALMIVALMGLAVLGLVTILGGGWGILLGAAIVVGAALVFAWLFAPPPDEGWTDDGDGI